MPDIKKFVINLKRRPDRLELFKRRCPFNDVTIINAFDGKNMRDETCAIEKDMASRFTGLDPGEIGCFLSHLRIFNIMRRENISYALIFEDDAIFCDNFLNIYSKVIDELPSDTDILYIGGRFEPGFKMRDSTKVSDTIVKHRIENNRILGLPDHTDRTTHAYIVSNAFVNKFTEQFYTTMRHTQPIDSYLLGFCNTNKFTIYNSYPLLCHSPMISDSDIRIHIGYKLSALK
jgi:GR25 family glycosyltransferase involved in LPS biosynthesis